MSIGLLGKKIGMTRVYDDKGKATTATVIEARGNEVLQVKTVEKDGYSAVQVGFGDQKPQRVAAPMLGHFKKSGATPKRFIREFRLGEDEQAPEGREIPLSVFETGQTVDVIGQSKGKGFQGVIKRHGFHRQPMSHGSMMHRRPGAVGGGSTPGRIWKNTAMPGHTGDRRITVQNLKVLQIREEDGVILVDGPIPGANGSFVIVRPGKKAS